MCQNSDYKIISFLETGAPHCFENAAAGYGGCWSASERCQMGADLLVTPTLQDSPGSQT